MKKILIYNWIPFDETDNKGGGVSVYTKNLIGYLVGKKEWEIYFLSSGRAYDLRRRDTFVEQTENIFGEECKSFQVVNSPVLSSAHLSFAYSWTCYQDSILKTVLYQFLTAIGGVDVIHFQNLEGLSLGVLELKKEFPGTKFIYSLHNYYLFCPQVMLWKEDSVNCREEKCGGGCIDCMPSDVHRRKVIFNQWLNEIKRKNGVIPSGLEKVQRGMEDCCSVYDRLINGKISRKKRARLTQVFRTFREKNIWCVNEYVDDILAVSKRVAELAVCYGVKKEKVRVSYIGTDMAERQIGYSRYPYDGGLFHICYLGYMRRAKGFYFLIDALEAMPEQLAGKMKVTLATKVTDEKVEKRIDCLKERFAGFVIYEGYTRDKLPQILENVQLGIVPHLWEDNLPQVAIEMKAHGIPVLASHLGGAKELTASSDFVFEAGDIQDFINKINMFVKFPGKLEEYWEHAPALITMEEHIEELLSYYSL